MSLKWFLNPEIYILNDFKNLKIYILNDFIIQVLVLQFRLPINQP